MPRKSNPSGPPYSHHRATGRAYVRIRGRCYYLGKWQSPESREKYNRLVAEYLTEGDVRPQQAAASLTIVEVCERYYAQAKSRYCKREVSKVKTVVGLVCGLYGSLPVEQFGPVKLRTLQRRMTDAGLHPATNNGRVRLIRKIFRWAVGMEMAPASLAHALREVEGLPVPFDPVLPAPEPAIWAASAKMPPAVACMVELQLWTGARSGEVCRLTPSAIARDWPVEGVWSYEPAEHKTKHKGHRRVILIGPRAQRILTPWLESRAPDEFVFQPADALPWQPKADRARPVGACYTPESYARAVNRACLAAGVEPWSPGQLRHNAATKVASEFSPEIARILLGHRSVATTRQYFIDDLIKAADAAKQAG